MNHLKVLESIAKVLNLNNASKLITSIYTQTYCFLFSSLCNSGLFEVKNSV